MPTTISMTPQSRLPRGNSPLRTNTKPNDFVPVVNEAKLVRTIQILDETWNSDIHRKISPTIKDINGKHRSASSLLSDSLRDAICYLLEIVSLFDRPGLAHKSDLETVCTARILGCLKRFYVGCAKMDFSIGECCQQKCEQRLLHLALLCILFRMCREPQIASSVIKEGLHEFLIKICETSNPNLQANLISHTSSILEVPREKPFDPDDLLISIDPFDWSYQSLCTKLMKEEANHAFFAPVGIRSLTCLLQGVDLPTDEISEFELNKSTRRDPGRKQRKLPSIFTFPRCTLLEDNTSNKNSSTKTSQQNLPLLCCSDRSVQHESREIQTFWTVVLSGASKTHLALRSLAVLAHNLPRSSAESRTLLREGTRMIGVFQKIKQKAELSISPDHLFQHKPEAPSNEILSPPTFQTVAIQLPVLKRLAFTTLTLFTDEHAGNLRNEFSLCSRKALAPISNERRCIPRKNDYTNRSRGVSKPLSLTQRLQSATTQAHSEYVQLENSKHAGHQAWNSNRIHRRLAIRNRCANVERLREHLMNSLEVLYSGRQHPDPQQEFSEWIKSLPTIETFERERLYQQEMRHRQALEAQYQREAVRRREREECTKMQVNDFNVPKDSEIMLQQEKHERFLRMQAEMRQLEQRDSKDEATAAKTAAQRAKLEQEERQRFQLLESQRREARELERLQREDFYYVERILQAKAKAKEEQEKQEKNDSAKVNAIEEQRQRIARMRFLDQEKRLTERETSGMRVEDLFGRQMRYRCAEMAKKELHDEWHARKTMQAEDQDSRTRWAMLERAMKQQEQEMLKQQRAEERRLRRQQRREEEQMKATWIENWDEWGNRYYYNSISGLSQWEVPT